MYVVLGALLAANGILVAGMLLYAVGETIEHFSN